MQATLRDAPYAAYFWETPPLSPATAHLPAEYAIVDAPALARVEPDMAGFASELRGRRVASFWNLSRDALLVVPADEGIAYPHLAAFARSAPPDVSDLFWRKVAEEALAWDRGPVWVSTHGLGVYWLHVRLDVRPKYYRHAGYR